MSEERSKSIFTSTLAWIGSFFLWFITPTGAAALWDKWTKEKVEESVDKDKK
jgi:hypothetical protein